VHVTRIGFTPVKGGRHVAHPHVDLGPAGPEGDRMLCLVDPARGGVLRTVRHPELLRAVATLAGDLLDVELDGVVASGRLAPTGDLRKVDYWGRRAEVELLDGPWTALYAGLTGADVRLARVVEPGAVVYGGGVSLVTTASLHALSARVGRPVAAERFRPTFVVDGDGGGPGVETSWVGREVTVGSAVLRVRDAVPRCGVVDLDPVSGVADIPVLRALAGYRRGQGEPRFGVDADVVEPGRVCASDALVLGRS
jgi:uncharacterized protein YcbX